MTRKDRLNEFAIYAISFISMASAAINPALAMIAKSFPELSTTQIQMIITIPSFAMMLTSFASPPLLKRLSLKTLYLLNLVVVLVFSTVPFFCNNFTLIVVLRSFAGFSFSFMQILLTVTITTWFPVSRQGHLMGGRTIATSAGAIIISYFGGVISDIDWHYTFLLFLSVAPIILITWLFLYKMPPQKAETPKKSDTGTVQTIPRKKVFLDMITVFICMSAVAFLMFLQSYNTNIALMVDAENFGTATDSGVSVAIFNASGIICGMLMPTMQKKLKGRALFVTFLTGMLGTLLIGLSSSIYMVHVGSFFAGFSLMALLGFVPLDVTGTLVTKETYSYAVSLMAITVSFSGFITPYVVIPIANIFNAGSVRTRFIISGIMILIIAIAYETIRQLKYRKHYTFYSDI